MEKQNIPLVRLGDVATWLRPGDKLRHENGSECTIATASEKEVHTGGLALNTDGLFALLYPRLELVPVGGVIKAGTPYSYFAGGEWGDFEPHVEDFVNRCDDCYCQLIRDEPEQLPREVIAGPDTLRARDVVEFVCVPGEPVAVAHLNCRGPFSVLFRCASGVNGWQLSSSVVVLDGDTVRLLSRANQDPPAAEAQPEAGPQLEPDFTRVIRVGSSGEVEFINIASTNVTVAPKPAAPEKLQAAVEVCGWCREPFWAGRIIANKRNRFCADCEAFRVYPQDSWESNHPLRPAPDPHAHLTQAQRYHLDDDPDASGIPEGN